MSLFEPGEIDELRKRCPAALTFHMREEHRGLLLGVGAVFPNGANCAFAKQCFRRSDRAKFITEVGDAINKWWNETGRHMTPDEIKATQP